MLYKCPYCGEPVITQRVRLGIVWRQFGDIPSCPVCKHVFKRNCIFGSRILSFLLEMLLYTVGVLLFILPGLLACYYTGNAFFLLLGLVLFAVVWYIWRGKFQYIDVAANIPRRLFDVRVSAEAGNAFAVGDVVIVLPDAATIPPSPGGNRKAALWENRRVTLVQKRQKDENGAILTLRMTNSSVYPTGNVTLIDRLDNEISAQVCSTDNKE